MKASEILNGNVRRLVVAVSAAIILFPLGFSLVSAAFSDGPQLPESRGGAYCLAEEDDEENRVPREYMRYHHMDLLKQTRDEIVREGKGEVWFYDGPRKVEFDDCRNCHPSREDFCNRCHKPVNLYLGITCFRCHEY